MQVILDPDRPSPPSGPLVATIGNFDGVHRGHQWVIGNVRHRARELGARSAVITFDPHPSRALRPEHPHSLITPLGQKLALLAETGVDLAVVLPFTRELAGTSARSFAQDILRDRLGVIELHEGENFRFGHNAEADIHTLAALGEELGFRTVHYPAQIRAGSSISSSRIRSALLGGDVSAARRLLGRPFSIESTPAPGRGYGTRYTVPTVNLAPYDELIPANGVYITTLEVGNDTAITNQQIGRDSANLSQSVGSNTVTPNARIGGDTTLSNGPVGSDSAAFNQPVARFEAVTNIGNRPTFGEDSFTIESHLLDFHPIPLTENTPLRLNFLHYLRPEIRWPSPEALREQIGKDVAQARRFFSLCRELAPCAR